MALPPFKVKAVYDYSSPHEDDLNFPAGQVITVTEKEDEDWYIGEYTDDSGTRHDGLFPKNFVEKYEPPVPSRPARAGRPASEYRAPAPPAPAAAPAPQPGSVREAEEEAPEEQDEESGVAEPAQQSPRQSRAIPPIDTSVASRRKEEPALRSPPPSAAAAAAAAAPAPQTLNRQSKPVSVPAPAPAPAEKKAPPPVSEKPSSFKDRIAAFNKSSAAPVAPFKPTGSAPSFIKKPFVPPPPSSNAYVPPPRAEPVQKLYRREEDPEIQEKQEQDRADAEKAGLLPQNLVSSPVAAGGDEEDAPKPQSLKERIAMLQKQQMEQAARRADVSQKEKPKKPVKKNTEDSMGSINENAVAADAPPPPVPAVPASEDVEEGSERPQRGSLDQPQDRVISDRRASYAPSIHRTNTATTTHTTPATAGPEQDTFSDANDADVSTAAETTEENDMDSDGTQPARKSVDASRAPTLAPPRHEPGAGQEEDTVEEKEESEEDEMDAETRRRLELRERMAKMSGGMGMAGMFGPPGGMPMGVPPQKKKSTRESRHSEDTESVRSPTGAPQIPMMMPIPGMAMHTVRSPEAEDKQLAVEKEADETNSEATAPVITSERGPRVVPDVEDVKPQPAPRASLDRGAPPVPRERPLSSPTAERAGPPPVPGDRAAPPPPAPEARAVPPPPPPVAAAQLSDSEGSESDDELSAQPRTPAIDAVRTAPPPVPTGARPNSSTRSPPAAGAKRASYFQSDAASPTSPTSPQPSTSDRRASRVPPIPGTGPLSPGLSRAPPPPPPTAEPFAQAPPVPRPAVEQLGHTQEESEYEGDYDTDIASSAKHKDALKSHAREVSLDDSTTAEEPPLSPPVPPPHAPSSAPRAVPPPPPSQPASNRMSMDAPRLAPPPPPLREPEHEMDEEEEDLYQAEAPGQTLPVRAVPPPPPPSSAPGPPPAPLARQDSSDDLYSASPPRRSVDRAPPPPPHAVPVHDRSPQTPTMQSPAPTFSPHPPSRQSTRQSLDVPRASMSARRSMDQSRPSVNEYIATDVDLGERTQWWAAPDLPPPVFQNRNDVRVEIEESSTSRRGGKTTIAKDVYVLFMDYSQTVITARFDSREPSDVAFEMRHEPPPQRLRQDQLESFWQQFGARIADAAAAKRESVVGDGSPRALVIDLLRPLRDALLPIGSRAYGALVYANLANASVQQFDEIRAGDIITLRNAKLQGKHGTMHQKYAMDVGMQGKEHVAIVVDWDGTKKKVRALEQGREKPKVRMESFRLGDLKSGEVRVWRVVGRQWVGWETGH